MTPKVLFIHGAAASPLSFNWLKGRLKPHDAIDITYDTQTPLTETISHLRGEVLKCNLPPLIVGHSLGGVIAVSIAQAVPVCKVVTMASPFGGSFAASVMRWFMPTQLLRDIAQQSPVLSSLSKNPPRVPILSFVTDSNLTVMGERTDGVVTVRSQMALEGPDYVTVPLNHFEVLLSQTVADRMNEFLFAPEPHQSSPQFVADGVKIPWVKPI